MTGTYWVHKTCDGLVFFDLSGGFCQRCHAENLDPTDIDPRNDDAEMTNERTPA